MKKIESRKGLILVSALPVELDLAQDKSNMSRQEGVVPWG